MHDTPRFRSGLVPVLVMLTIAPCLAQDLSASGPASQSQEADHPRSTVSQVRIVRLSQAEGQVQLDRGTAQKYEPAFVNLPIVAGERLRTQDGLAEVEFEDNSSLRLTPNTEIEFPALGRQASGATTSTVKLLGGSLYMNLGNETVSLTPGSHLRIDVTPPSARLAVFNGSVTLADQTGTLVVGKKKTVSFDTVSGAAPVFAQNEPEARFDKWDKEAVDYHKARASAASFAGSPYAYGVNDLGYYGSFTDLGGGCGSLWRPYLASAAWDPYGSGVWGWYPGSGYSWVSPYPWGWTPYHSGSWEYCPSGGWGWRPSGSWNGLSNQPAIRRVQGRGLPIPREPRLGESTLVPVNVKSLPVSKVESGATFVFRGDSAGMGVPRSIFGNLGKVSQSVNQHGLATASLSDSQAQRGFIAISRPVSSAASGSSDAHGFSSQASGAGRGMASSSVSMSSSAASSAASSGHAGGGSSSSAVGGHH
jgi:hypothetical protein